MVSKANGQPQTRVAGFDLVAHGQSGKWSAFIDETHSGPERLFAQIKGPSVYLSFEIPSASVIGALLQFLEQPSPSKLKANKVNKSLRLGVDKNTPVSIIRDDECQDRFTLAIGSAKRGLVARYSVDGADLKQLTNAVRKVCRELATEGITELVAAT